MVAQLDSYLASQETLDHHHHHDDPYEAEETLSLCDLPTYSDDFSKDYQSSSFDRDEDNFFEFFSEEFTASTYGNIDKDIIFCGKLIPYNKDAPQHVEQTEKKIIEPGKTLASTKKWGIFRWRRSKGSKHRVVVRPSQGKEGKNGSVTNKKSYKRCDVSLGKVSIFSSNRSRSKWYLFMFGVTRFPTEIELRDMKSRQSRRRSPSSMFGANCEVSDEATVKSNNKGLISDGRNNNNNNNNNNRAKGLWGILRAIGCSSQHPNAVVKSSFL